MRQRSRRFRLRCGKGCCGPVSGRGLLSADDAQTIADWEHGGGFSVDAEMRIGAHECDGLERLLRYCARSAFVLERLREIDTEHLVYESVKPGPGVGVSVSVLLTPLQLLDRLAALIPPPRRHRHRYYGARTTGMQRRVFRFLRHKFRDD